MDIEGDYRLGVRLPSRQASFPLNHERHADTAFKDFSFRAAEGVVARGRLRCGAAVIADEEDQSVLFQLQFAQLLQDSADCIIECREHRRKRATFCISDSTE